MHSADTSMRQHPATTEIAVRTLVSLGVPRALSELQGAKSYLERLISDLSLFPDPAEANGRWPIGTELFTASTLALIVPDNERLDGPVGRWADIALAAFSSGEHRLRDEQEAHRRVHSLTEALGYIRISAGYAVELLGSRATSLPAAVRLKYAEWLSKIPQPSALVRAICEWSLRTHGSCR